MISHCLLTVKVNIEDVMRAYYYYGFNEEVTMLLQHFKLIEDSRECYRTVEFVFMLEAQGVLSINNLSKLDLMQKQSHRKLISSVSEELLDGIDSIKLKRQILNQIPTLFDMSVCVVRKHLQAACRIRDSNKLCTAVESLSLPRMIKTVLRDNQAT
ncbi:hypothetical protein ILUMI_16646 [Ignelater luminosus]|uniref:Uncharacterized protein n=1 Tax=Ignelater luminosus TaxID=2038154 RepID=A0A8K0G5S1_IGNLU|nr:hypothetical protein ILUMI_16646 [Ignelater luminosus]